MTRKERYAQEICDEMDKWRSAAWVDDIEESTMQRVITVCQNVVKSWAHERKGRNNVSV